MTRRKCTLSRTCNLPFPFAGESGQATRGRMRVSEGPAQITTCVPISTTRPVGIVTDRDLAMRVIAAREDADRTRIADVMSQPVMTASPVDRIETVTRRMRQLGVR